MRCSEIVSWLNVHLIALDNLGVTYFIGLDGKIKKQNQIFKKKGKKKMRQVGNVEIPQS